MKWIVVFVTLFIADTILSQIKGDFIWIGGTEWYPDETKVNGHITDFKVNGLFPKQQDMRFGFASNNSSICDDTGNLLFYTNGCAVMNRYHEVMPNGDSINAGQWFDIYWKNCLYGYPGPQDVMIINDPANLNGYYLFHKANVFYPMIADSFQLMFSYIDMSLDGGKGDVILKNKKYYNKQDVMYSYFTGIKHKNKKDWWIIQPLVQDSMFLIYYLNESGITLSSKQNSNQFFTKDRSSAGGTAKFSPDGTKYALYNYNDQLHIYEFDREKGILSNHKKIEIYHPDSIDRSKILFSSVEWSPNGRFVYCASSEKLHQVDTWASNPQNGIRHIADYNGALDPFPTRLFLMAQGPDCRIYMTPKNGSYSLHVINKPDELGTACDFVQNAIKLPNSNSGTLPNFPRFRVDETDKCDPKISSVFGDAVYYRRQLNVYPNPSSGVFRVTIPDGFISGTMVVTNLYGQVLMQKSVDNVSIFHEIDITSLPGGVYNIEIYPTDNRERIFYGKQVVKL
ncbi:MAG: hypothetical protein IPM42_15030 [Saprospiraceae bacterium]|nr:hypothetical protein [Saprospiraceae bacterium]